MSSAISHACIIHLYRSDGSSLYLDSFVSDERILAVADQPPPQGLYGAEPPVNSLHEYRRDIYQRIDAAVSRSVRERLFIPKFLAAAAVFLVTFLFMSLVILTPVPVLDEFLIAGAAAVAAYIGLGRLQNRGEKAARMRMQLRTRIDAVRFAESGCVRAVEGLLAEIEGLSSEAVLEQWPQLLERVPADCETTLQTFAELLQARLPQAEKLTRLLAAVEQPTAGVEDVIQQHAKRYKLDFSLFVLMRILQSVSAVSERFQ